MRSHWKRARRLARRGLVRVPRAVPPGLRLPLGLLLMGGGVLGFLPVLGFWMLPLGFGVAMLDLQPLWARLRGRPPRRRRSAWPASRPTAPAPDRPRA